MHIRAYLSQASICLSETPGQTIPMHLHLTRATTPKSKQDPSFMPSKIATHYRLVFPPSTENLHPNTSATAQPVASAKTLSACSAFSQCQVRQAKTGSRMRHNATTPHS